MPKQINMDRRAVLRVMGATLTMPEGGVSGSSRTCSSETR